MPKDSHDYEKEERKITTRWGLHNMSDKKKKIHWIYSCLLIEMGRKSCGGDIGKDLRHDVIITPQKV